MNEVEVTQKRIPILEWVIIIFLLAVIVGIGVKFIVLGSTAESLGADERTQVILHDDERQAVLHEMRTLLEVTQQIIEGLSGNNMEQVSSAATLAGMQATTTMDVTLKAKLPLEFKQLGFATHQAFDDIAEMADEGKPVNEIQMKLAKTMHNCLSCHAMYQIPSFNKF